eukprot:Polyplicarium_translucidae@DN2779_c0_g1_i1.p1
MEEEDFVVLADGQRLYCPKPNGEEEEKANKVVFEKVHNAWGSTAGAGSDFFHVYRKHRSVELARLKKMDEEWDEKMVQDEFRKRRTEGISEALSKGPSRSSIRKKQKRSKRRAAQPSGLQDSKPPRGSETCSNRTADDSRPATAAPEPSAAPSDAAPPRLGAACDVLLAVHED